MAHIVNLTQHLATPEQLAAGVFDLCVEAREELIKLLTFNDISEVTEDLLRARAMYIVDVLEAMSFPERERPTSALIGGAPYLMEYLAEKLWDYGLIPVYAFSARESEDVVQPDGSVRKVSVFRHQGFVPA